MPDLLHTIQQHLNTSRLRENLTPLFCQTLHWGRPQGAPRALTVGVPISQTLTVHPVAQLGGLPVLHVDWPSDRLPTITQRRAVQRALAPVAMEHLLCYVTDDAKQAAFVWARQRGDKVEMRTLPYEVGASARTTVERLAELVFAYDELASGEPSITAMTDKLNRAFDVEAVNKDFYANYETCFYDEVKPAVLKVLGDDADAHDFTQLLFNRLMFCWFLQKKGWLGGRRDYLLHLLERASRPRLSRRDDPADHPYTTVGNLYHDYLAFLFFQVLSNPEDERRKHQPTDPHVSWEAPFLNGGLFERTPLDERVEAAPRMKRLPTATLKAILQDLFARYNFTVEESTSLDVQVALDPELLGTIFEKLVTGRHETGSYYTPRPVVEFMCREALAHYLTGVAGHAGHAAIDELVYNHNVEGLSPIDATDIIRALDGVRACDLACGSGAYLVTLLHELVALYRAIYSEKLRDPKKDYDLKLRIIQRNLYGVDIDPFAVHIARLRLWLSLVVDNEETDWHRVQPLPNLDFKIEVGDSLTAPDPSGGLQPDMFRQQQVTDYFQLKTSYLMAHGGDKQTIRPQIDILRQQIADWAHPHPTPPPRAGEGQGGSIPFDWQVEFAEVFSTPPLVGEGLGWGQGGFDIILANPPYVRQEVVKQQLGDKYKPALVKLYPEAYVSTADLYVAFYARAHQLLKPGGVGCFISSNKWLRAGYGEKLRQHLLDSQAFHLVADFGDLPVFQEATAYPCIFLWQKQPRGDTPTTWAVVKNLQVCYDEGVREHITRMAQTLPASQFGKGKPRLAVSAFSDCRAKMEASGPRLGELVKGQIFRGIVTGLNEAFVVDRSTYENLVAADSGSLDILKPLIAGDDVLRYEINYRESYLIWTYIGVPIKKYPAVFKHLRQFQAPAEKRWDQGEHWWELRACDYYDVFTRPKIVYPQIGKEPRFVLDTQNYFPLKTVYCIDSDDWYLLGVLNSATISSLMEETLTKLRGGYWEFYTAKMETLPIPDAPTSERKAVARLAEKAQQLHTQRRKRVEQFLREIGTSPAQSSSRNPLEQPWLLKPDEFARRVKKIDPKGFGDPSGLYAAVRDETATLTEQIAKIEREIDERVAGLYGVELEK
jgi:hypothetical protein